MLNNITIAGRLTRDPELRRTQSGIAVCSFTLAVDRDVKDAQGYRQADFIDVVAWRQTAEYVTNYLSKGSTAVVSGRLQSRKWTDKNENSRISWEVQAFNVYGIGSNRSQESRQDEEEQDEHLVEVEDDGDLPF